MLRRWRSLAALALLCAIALVSDGRATEAAPPYYPAVFTITKEAGDYLAARIDGDVVIWRDTGDTVPDAGIRGYNMDSGEYFAVDDGGYRVYTGPAFAGDWVMWITDTDPSSGTKETLVMRNLRSHELRFPSQSSNVSWVHTDGHYVVWAHAESIYLYDIEADAADHVATQDSSAPVVEYPWLTWRVHEAQTEYAQAYNISTTQTLTVAVGGDARVSDICDGIAVWSANTREPLGRNIFGMDLKAGIGFTITESTHQHMWPQCDGDTVVWTDLTAESTLGYSLSTGEVFTVTGPAYGSWASDISGQTIVGVWRPAEPKQYHVIGARLYEHGVFLPIVERDYSPTPTPVPVCPCHADLFGCSDFDTQTDAQACYDYCLSQGAGDVHMLDWDKDGYACGTAPLGKR